MQPFSLQACSTDLNPVIGRQQAEGPRADAHGRAAVPVRDRGLLARLLQQVEPAPARQGLPQDAAERPDSFQDGDGDRGGLCG